MTTKTIHIQSWIKHFEIEIDTNRGVLYIHNRITGSTIVRVCGLLKKPALTGAVDVTITENDILINKWP